MPLPLVLEDGRACGLDVMRTIDGGYAPDTDRRRKVRVPLSLTVYLFTGTTAEPLEGRTKNVSSDGFYCYVNQAVAIGEGIRVIMMIPAYHPTDRDYSMSLEYHARVVRVDALEARRYGIACHIESYRVLPPEHDRTYLHSHS
jgi:hypothetical protein